MALRKFLIAKTDSTLEDVNFIVSEIYFDCTLEVDFDAHFEMLSEAKIFLKATDVNVFIGLVSDLANATRRWDNNGYTPNEISKIMYKPKIPVMFS